MSRFIPISLALLVLVTAIRLPGLYSRAIWYDEAITLLGTAGNARPTWPEEPRPAGDLQPLLSGAPTLAHIAGELRGTDVHPPLYYWALSYWRRSLGPSLEVARGFSLVCSVGSVLLLYVFCRAGKLRNPLLPTLTFAFSASAVHHAQEARAYAMAGLLLGAAAPVALWAAKGTAEERLRRISGCAATGALCAAAFLTNYMALFPAAVVALWLVLSVPRGRPVCLLVTAVAGAALTAPWMPALLHQLGRRTEQEAGFRGLGSELAHLPLRLLENVLLPATPPPWSGDLAGVIFLAGVGAIGILAVVSGVALFRAEPARPRFLALVLGLAAAPPVGLLLLNVLFDKHLDQARYVSFAGPAVAILLTCGVGPGAARLRRLGIGALALLWLAQLTCLNWGYEQTAGRSGSHYRSSAATIAEVSRGSHVVFAGAEHGRGLPGSLVHELPDATPVLFVADDGDPLAAARELDGYDDVWRVIGPARAVEQAVAEELRKMGRTSRDYPGLVLFRRSGE